MQSSSSTQTQTSQEMVGRSHHHWLWAATLTLVTVLLAYAEILIIGPRSDVQAPWFLALLLLIISPLVFATTVLFYHFIAAWAGLALRAKLVQVLLLLLVVGAVFSGGYFV